MSRYATLGLIALGVAFAQTQSAMQSQNLRGLPEIGVTLTGDPNTPTIVNNSGKRILCYTLRFQHAEGGTVTRRVFGLLARRDGKPSGIAPGGVEIFSGAAQVRPVGASPSRSVTLDAVLFETGELAGPDLSNTYEALQVRLRAEDDIHQMVLTTKTWSVSERAAVWQKLESIANGPQPANSGTEVDIVYHSFARDFAGALVQERKFRSEDAALALAGKSSRSTIPPIWRQK